MLPSARSTREPSLRHTIPTLLAVAWMAALAATVVHGTALAQDFDPSACQQACQEDHAACVAGCDEHSDPVECDAACRDDLEDCMRSCD